MNNSRSQTKIRKTQQVILLVEQRYLKQKGLLFENIEEFQECFDSFGLTNENIPESCKSVTNRDEFIECKNEINLAIKGMGNKVSEFNELFDCLEGKASSLGYLTSQDNINSFTDGFKGCFNTLSEFDKEYVPESCQLISNEEEFNTCIDDIYEEMEPNMDPEKVDSLIECLNGEATMLGYLDQDKD